MEQIKELLGDELFEQVKTKLGDKKLIIDPGEHMIPKSRLDEVIGQRDEFKTQLETVNNQITEFKEKIKSSDDLQAKLAELNNQNVKLKEEFDNKMKVQKLNFAVEKALLEQKAKNPNAVKGLLKMDSISIDGDNVIGLSEQLAKIKESDPYLFGDPKIIGDDPSVGDPPEPKKYGGYESKTDWAKKDPAGFAKARAANFK